MYGLTSESSRASADSDGSATSAIALFSIGGTEADRKAGLSNGKIEEAYNPFIINKTLSHFPDTIMQANTMNQYFELDKKLQYDFLLNSIRKKKRFSRWIKSNIEENVEIVKQYYKVGNEKAVEILSLLNDEQISTIKSELSEGGISGRRNNCKRIRGD